MYTSRSGVGDAVGGAGADAVAARASLSRIGRMIGREIGVRMYRRPAYWGKKRRANKGRQAGRPEPAKVRKNASVWWWEWGCGWLVRRANASSELLWLVGRDIAFD